MVRSDVFSHREFNRAEGDGLIGANACRVVFV